MAFTLSSKKMTGLITRTLMRIWPLSPSSSTPPSNGLAQASGLFASLVQHLGQAQFAQAALQQFGAIVPAASWSVYRIGTQQPALYMSASSGIHDVTRQCWGAYLAGPQHEDQSWGVNSSAPVSRELQGARMVHVRASEVSHSHRARVYEAHGMVERISIAEPSADGSVFAVNFYRHQHQKPFADGHLSDFSDLSAALLALTQKHIALMQATLGQTLPAAVMWDASASQNAHHTTHLNDHLSDQELWQQRLLTLEPGLTTRELQVCLRLLQGMTQDGVAADLGLSPPTVKTYRNRAFTRLGIQHRNQLFALVLSVR